MKCKLTGIRYSDKSLEIEYKFGFFQHMNDLQTATNNILHLRDRPTDEKCVVKEVKIFQDDTRKYRVLLNFNEDIDFAIDVEGLMILVALCMTS